MSNYLNRTHVNSNAAFTFFQTGILEAERLSVTQVLLMLMPAFTKHPKKIATEESNSVHCC